MNEHFTFFESYYSAVKDLDNDLKAQFYDVLFQYALYNQEPSEDINPVVKALFLMAKPNLDNSKAKREAGRKGGSKAKQSGSKTEANESKTEADKKQNGSKAKQSGSDKEKDKEKDKECSYTRTRTRKNFTPPTLQEVIEYQKEKCRLVNPKYFYDFFEVNDWKDSNGKEVLNWKQKMLTWQKAEESKANIPLQSKKIKLRPGEIFRQKQKPDGEVPKGHILRAITDEMGHFEYWQVIKKEGMLI